MKIPKVIGALAFLLVSATFSIAQQTDEPKIILKSGDLSGRISLFNSASLIDTPQSGGRWKVQIFSSGGIMGNGKGDLILTSEGIFSSSNPLSKGKIFNSEILQSLKELVLKVQIPEQGNSNIQLPRQHMNISLCNDCYTTTLILSRYEADGKIKTFITTWDITTRRQVADEILQVYERIIMLLNPMDQTTP